jgi:hypothetical protein
MRVYLPVRLSPFDPRDGNVKNPEPPPGPLMPGSEPDLAGHPGREREVRTSRNHDHRGAGVEDQEIVREGRVVRVLLLPVAYPARDLFCIPDYSDRTFPAGHSFLFPLWGGLKGLRIE